MNLVKFEKYQGLGNDFILFDGLKLPEPFLDENFIRKICDRHYGVGADGVLFFEEIIPQKLVQMTYFNADGSRAETCFNGLRCIALHAIRKGYCLPEETFTILTDSGEVQARVIRGKTVETLIPGPIFDPSKIPISASEPQCELHLSEGTRLQGTALSLGNPHFVVWTESTDLQNLNCQVKTIGREVEHHSIFPQRINFELASRVDTHKVFMAVWERGVGPTRACGSGATATVCAGVFQGILPPDEDITVEMEGGSLQIKVSPDLSRVSVRGPAHWVFSGNFPVNRELPI